MLQANLFFNLQVGNLGRVGVNAARTVMAANKRAQEFALARTAMEAPEKRDRVTCTSATVRQRKGTSRLVYGYCDAGYVHITYEDARFCEMCNIKFGTQ